MTHHRATTWSWLPALQTALFLRVARVLPPAVTPNVLTTFRLVLALVLAILFRADAVWWAALAYALAVFTDPLDGELARLRGLASAVGARFDPAVDKILHAVAFLAFFRVEPVLLGTLLGLDVMLLIVSVPLVLWGERRAWDFSSSVFGKAKMTAQALGVSLLFWNALVLNAPIPLFVVRGVLVLAAVLSLLSMASYAKKLRAVRAAD